MRPIDSYKSLIAWRRADDLFVRLHRLTYERFPVAERYELGAQLRRAAFSVPNNIVEGTARFHRRERLQFLRTSWASVVEVSYCLHAARRLGYVDDALYQELDGELRRLAAPLLGLIRTHRLTVHDDDGQPRPRLTRRAHDATSPVPARTK
jgi:four helix bundle protein